MFSESFHHRVKSHWSPNKRKIDLKGVEDWRPGSITIGSLVVPNFLSLVPFVPPSVVPGLLDATLSAIRPRLHLVYWVSSLIFPSSNRLRLVYWVSSLIFPSSNRSRLIYWASSSLFLHSSLVLCRRPVRKSPAHDLPSRLLQKDRPPPLPMPRG